VFDRLSRCIRHVLSNLFRGGRRCRIPDSDKKFVFGSCRRQWVQRLIVDPVVKGAANRDLACRFGERDLASMLHNDISNAETPNRPRNTNATMPLNMRRMSTRCLVDSFNKPPDQRLKEPQRPFAVSKRDTAVSPQ
jgi:hypothetical protein